jgi:hypothetical protein
MSSLYCKDSSRDYEKKGVQKQIMDEMIKVAKSMNYVDGDSTKSSGQKFYFVHEPSSISSIIADTKYPYLSLHKYEKPVSSKTRQNEKIKSNVISISLQKEENRGCYIEGDHISVFVMKGDTYVDSKKFGTLFWEKPLREKEPWKREIDFVQEQVKKFDSMKFE